MGVAALSLPLAARAGASSGIFAGGDEQRAEPLYKIVFDERYAACIRFAEELERRALATSAIRGDITDLWYEDLYHRWRKGTAAIAGMTAPGAIFCLEILARDAGMRVAMRVDHRRVEERIEHEFAGPAESLTLASEIQTSAGRWPERMAEMVARFPTERGRAMTARYSGQAERFNGEWEHLVTWVIAPAGAKTTSG